MTTRSPADWVIALLALGCGAGPPEDFADCADADCEVAWLTAHWDANPDDVLAKLSKLEEPSVQVVAVQALAEAHPGETQRICDVLPHGAALERCRILNSRPHLWQIDTEAPDEGTHGASKVFYTLTPTSTLTSPWLQLAAVAAPCPDGNTPSVCQSEAAWTAAAAGRVRDAAGACMGIEDGKWRYECFFQAAERAFVPGESGSIGDAINLCLGADFYVSRCLGHLAGNVAHMAPDAGDTDIKPWVRINRYADEARRTLQPIDPGLAERFSADLWGRAATVSYSSTDPIVGNPLDTVEPHAVPHFRAAAAWRMMEGGMPAGMGLGDLQVRLDELLAARSTTPSKAVPLNLELIKVQDMWSREVASEVDIPWVPYLTGKLRAIHADPAVDGVICVLEGAARSTRKMPGLFEAGLGHDDPLVRWTAARLLRGQPGSEPLLQTALSDSDPRVVERARLSLEARASEKNSARASEENGAD